MALLNFAPDAAHHLSKILKRVAGLSFLERKTVASSANSARMTLWWVSFVVILSPVRSSVDRRMCDIGSIAILNRRHESGSPCLMPRITRNFSLISPFRIMAVSAFEYRDFIVFTRPDGTFIASRVCHR